jgi:DNA-binding NtrC family response regulator
VRELKNELRRSFILSGEELELDDLAAVTASHFDSQLVPEPEGSIEQAERKLILVTLERCGGDKKRAAELLGISLKTLYNRLHVYART